MAKQTVLSPNGWRVTLLTKPPAPNHSLPALLDADSLFDLLNISPRYPWYAIKFPTKCYSTFWVDKDTKEFVSEFDSTRRLREICAPTRSLKFIQGRIASEILTKLPMHEANFAYMQGRNVRGAAERHTEDVVLLRVDMKDFFPSHHFPFVMRRLRELTGYPETICWCIAKLCSLRGSLPQGAVTSPLLSIVLNYEMDASIAAWAASKGLSYTRYADDMVFGSKTDIDSKTLWGYVKTDILNLVHPFTINFDKVDVMRHRTSSVTVGVKTNAYLDETYEPPAGFKMQRRRTKTIIHRREPLTPAEYALLTASLSDAAGPGNYVKPHKRYTQSIKRMLGLNLTSEVHYPRKKYNKLRLEAFLAAKDIARIRDVALRHIDPGAPDDENLFDYAGEAFLARAQGELIVKAIANEALQPLVAEFPALMSRIKQLRGRISYVKMVDAKRGHTLENILYGRKAV